MSFDHLFAPGVIGALELKNRVVMLSMGLSLANRDGTVSDAELAFYEARARGGAGLIITGCARVNDETGVGRVRQISMASDRVLPGLARLVATAHHHGSALFVQLYHPGAQAMAALQRGGETVSPSAVMSAVTRQPCRALTVGEIEALVEDFVDAARRAREAGGDGVEIHCAHGYLLNQFLSPYTNRRTDDYGGSMERRARIVRDIILGVRQACGPDYPVSMRLSVDEFLRLSPLRLDGLVLEEGLEVCRYLVGFGLDAINVSCGTYDNMNLSCEPISYAEAWRGYLAEAVKGHVDVPVITAGVYRNPGVADRVIREGKADFVGMARSFLADPDWVAKAKAGRVDQIRRCISCLRCMESLRENGPRCEPLECAVNPLAAHELEYQFPKDGAGRVVVVVGGGPAGLQAAVTLAERGFRPVLFERARALGGQLRLAAALPGKAKLTWLIEYYIAQLAKHAVEVRLGAEPTEHDLLQLQPYAVVAATGATPVVPASPAAAAGAKVCTVAEILGGSDSPEGVRVVVVGAGLTGLETADFLARQGNQVTVVEALDVIGGGGYDQNVADVAGHLDERGVKVLCGRLLQEVAEAHVVVKSLADGSLEELAADQVVLCIGLQPERTLVPVLESSFERVVVVGDAAAAGRIGDAVKAAFLAAASL